MCQDCKRAVQAVHDGDGSVGELIGVLLLAHLSQSHRPSVGMFGLTTGITDRMFVPKGRAHVFSPQNII